MRTLKLTVAICITAALFIFVACNTTEDDPSAPSAEGYFTYDGTTYAVVMEIINSYRENTGPGESGYYLDYTVLTSGVDWTTGDWTGTGSGVTIDLNSPTLSLAPGTYSWSDTRTDFTIIGAVVYIDYDFGADAGTAVMVSGGTLTVSVDEDTHTVEFTLTAGSKTITGRYSRPPTVPRGAI